MLRRRRGFIVWLMLFVGLVLSIVLYGYLYRSSSSYRLTSTLYQGQVAAQLTAGAVEAALAALRGSVDDPAGPIHAAVVASTTAAAADGVVELSDIEGFERVLEGLRASVLGGRGVSLDVRAVVTGTTALVADPSQGWDPREKRGALVVTATATVGAAQRRRVATYPFKVVSLVVPVVSKFTFFLQHPEANGTNPRSARDASYGGYNRFLNRIDGTATSARSNPLPLVVYNHPVGTTLGLHDYDHRKLGWIFFGSVGGGRMVLNLTCGSDSAYGEYFQYKSLEYNNQLQAARHLEYYVNATGASVPELFRTVFGYSPADGEHGTAISFRIKRRRLGFFAQDLQSPAGTMDAGLLGSDADSYTAGSSTLHLFGSNKDASPTLVLGPVYRSYPEYAGITVDVDGDGTQDGTCTPLLAYEATVPLGCLDATFEASDGSGGRSTYEFAGLTGGAAYDSSGARAFSSPNLFSDQFPYDDMMSTFVVEPYNRGVDAMTAAGLAVPPPRHRDWDDGYYPSPGDDVTIPRLASGAEPYFSGSLDDMPPRVVSSRLTHRFATLDEFVAWTGGRMGAVLDLGHNVRIEGDVDLTGVTSVGGGGQLAAPRLSLDALDRSGEVPVSLVALQGDLTVGFSGPVKAALVALEGTLVPADQARPVALQGCLTLGSLRPDALPAGGELRYDPDLDPVAGGNGYEKSFRWFAADAAEAVVLQ